MDINLDLTIFNNNEIATSMHEEDNPVIKVAKYKR